MAALQTNRDLKAGRRLEAAMANDIEPHAYLRTVFTELPDATSAE